MIYPAYLNKSALGCNPPHFHLQRMRGTLRIAAYSGDGENYVYRGLIEHSSGERQRRGGIIKTGNSHVRRVLVEAAWTYRFPARKTRTRQKRAEQCDEKVQVIAWDAQKRLCHRYRHLTNGGKLKVQACTAVARELAGFI